MDRSAGLGLVALSLFLLTFPLTLTKPGVPQGLKADEAAYYLMAMSLAHDGDLRLAEEDTVRLFHEFPHRATRNLIVMSDDGFETAFYSKPIVHAILSAPLARLFGANGLLLFNMILLVGMIWMGWDYLRRFNPGPLAALFSGGFFLVGATWSYAFWIQPEMLSMFGVMAALYLGLDRESPDRDWRNRPGLGIFLSGVALAIPVYNKPMFALLALPVLVVPFLERSWRIVTTWFAGFVVAFGAISGAGLGLTGHASPYLGGMQRVGVRVCEPGVLPTTQLAEAMADAAPQGVEPAVGEPSDAALPADLATADVEAAPTGEELQGALASRRTFGWIFRIPPVTFGELFDNIGYFLWGRHTGLIVYFPFAALSVLLFLLNGRESLRRWALLVSLAGVAFVFLYWISWNWQGGGGFIGNRYYVSVIPAFLFLTTRIAPTAMPLVGFAMGGLFLGPLLLSPFGSMAPEPTLQAHTRNAPLRWLPLELTLRNVPGYHNVRRGGVRFRGRTDQIVPRGDGFWVAGARTVNLVLSTREKLVEPVFLLRDVAPGTDVRVALGRGRQRATFTEPGEALRVKLRPERPDQVYSQYGERWYVYELSIHTDNGHVRHWTREYPPNPCDYFAHNPRLDLSFYKGAELIFLGDASEVDAQVFAVEWGAADVPETATPGERFQVQAFLYNRSQATWKARGPASVKLSYHWRATDGRLVVQDGLRSELPGDVEPNVRTAVTMQVQAPDLPGEYVLEIDPVLEHVAWFSDRREGRTYRHRVEVTR